VNVEVHPAAKRELDEAILYFERARPRYGLRFADAFDAWSQRIAAHPKIGRRVGRTVRRVVLRDWRYSILYVIKRDHILIVAVAHQSRRRRSWRSRLR
jgi:toxin ParE1/3/4